MIITTGMSNWRLGLDLIETNTIDSESTNSKSGWVKFIATIALSLSSSLLTWAPFFLFIL
jgi:hypothetical protein